MSIEFRTCAQECLVYSKIKTNLLSILVLEVVDMQFCEEKIDARLEGRGVALERTHDIGKNCDTSIWVKRGDIGCKFGAHYPRTDDED